MILGLIPSRLNSRRLKKKPLLKIDGLPIIVHTLKRAQLSKKLDKVMVCTDSKEILKLVKDHGGEAVITSKKHRNGTERIQEVAKKYKAKLIVDIQGDEPLIDPKDIDKVINFHLQNKKFDIVLPHMKTKYSESNSVVKMAISRNNVIYFSREKIPYNYKKKKNFNYFKDLSIVSFTPKALSSFCNAKFGELERIEGIELMRALENGLKIGTFYIKGSAFSVDIKEDLFRAIDLMPRDKIRRHY